MTRWLLVLVLVGGCSFTLDGPDPKTPRSRAPVCETGKGRVVTDLVLASIAGTLALGVVGSDAGVAVAPGLVAALLAGSAIHGNNTVESCRNATDAYEALRRHTAAPVVAHAAADPDGAPPAPEPVTAAAPAPSPAPVSPPVTINEWGEFWKEIR